MDCIIGVFSSRILTSPVHSPSHSPSSSSIISTSVSVSTSIAASTIKSKFHLFKLESISNNTSLTYSGNLQLHQVGLLAGIFNSALVNFPAANILQI